MTVTLTVPPAVEWTVIAGFWLAYVWIIICALGDLPFLGRRKRRHR